MAKNHFLCDTKNNPLFEINCPIRARRNTNWFISVDPSCYKRLFDEQGLYFEFSRFRFDNFFSVKQCRHCRRFSHTTKCCPGSKDVLCTNCGMDHLTSDCKQINCINSLESNQRFKTNFDLSHGPFDRIKCECFVKKKANLVRLTNYGTTPVPPD
ncbi:hypothetical protein AVEN_39029-1 [Araneus ventricosus]|uniref:CCHC-type domain-containing protein n=1 Tax=Araneus ventricosus TaxID=182803 RepID=A0A4Y2MFA8_ARAVE|nr:hypothetical protein AVEN_39029-1 [Araneus ventricosus]